MSYKYHTCELRFTFIAKKMAEQIQVLNIRLPSKIIEWIDSLVDSGLYSSRSEVIRDLMRNYLEENR